MTEITTIQEGKAFLRENFEKGAKCPCCDQYVKLYKRKLTSAMVYGLMLIAKAHPSKYDKSWLHVEDYLKSLDIPASIRGDIAKLKLWGFLLPAEGNREDGSPRNGYYQLTQQGRDFVKGRITAFSHVLIYNNSFRGFEGEQITVQEALGSKFNYDELMKGSL